MQQSIIDDGAQDRDIGVLADLARQWVEVGWRHTSEEPFDFRGRLKRFYDWSSDGTQFFDDFDTKRRINTNVAQYAAIWDERIPAMRQLTNVLIGEPRTLVSGDLAVMSVQFVTSYTTAEGHADKAHTISSLVWRRSSDGWRIVREHGSGLAVHDGHSTGELI
jgi:ketosteroid isomerase-like protein